jgi:dTDP-4-dehydrorhamnose 3,5-epimerase
MKLVCEPLAGVRVLQPFLHRDERGEFVKPFHEGQFAQHGLKIHIREEFFSVSNAGVLRGMHFQLPPHDHQKLVYCVRGSVLDVILDLRRGSSTYGKSVGVELSSANRHVIYIPVGFAHGFLSLEDDSCLIYKTDSVHAPSHDAGILWSSFGFAWPEQSPLLSPRDLNFPPLAQFTSPFEF